MQHQECDHRDAGFNSIFDAFSGASKLFGIGVFKFYVTGVSDAPGVRIGGSPLPSIKYLDQTSSGLDGSTAVGVESLELVLHSPLTTIYRIVVWISPVTGSDHSREAF